MATGQSERDVVRVAAGALGVVLGQKATEEKSNKITAIPELLKTLALQGTIVTIDAMGTQTKIAETIRKGEADYVVTLAAPRVAEASIYEIQPIPSTVRLIRDVTPGGNIRVLMTNLLDARRYPAEQFGALYHRRWRVEEAFKRIKHRLHLEAPSGLTYLAFQQDFAAKVLADNLCQLLSAETEPPDAASRPNRTYAQGALKPILAGCLLALEHARNQLQTVLNAIACNHCRVQPERSYPRPRRVKPHQHLAYKGA